VRIQNNNNKQKKTNLLRFRSSDNLLVCKQPTQNINAREKKNNNEEITLIPSVETFGPRFSCRGTRLAPLIPPLSGEVGGGGSCTGLSLYAVDFGVGRVAIFRSLSAFNSVEGVCHGFW
jgi:hypothetical protein